MPARFPSCTQVLATLASTLALVHAQAATVPASPPPPATSSLDARLFYQLLIGEIELGSGDAGTAYQIVFDAARKTRNEQLFRHATEIALQARAGDQALSVAQAWREEWPRSVQAHRYVIQLLVALNRLPDTVEPMRSLLALTPAAERPTLIMYMPRFYSRSRDRSQVSAVLDELLQPYAEAPATRSAVHVAWGRAALAAHDAPGALASAQRAHQQDPSGEGPALLALEILPFNPNAEALVTDHLNAKPGSNSVRVAYAQILSRAQRYGDAAAQLEIVTRHASQLGPPWLMLGALYLELRQPDKATPALQRYLQLPPDLESSASSSTESTPVSDDEASGTGPADRGTTQAWLMLSQAAEQRGDFKEAQTWLDKVTDASRAFEVLTRRASLLARQGKLDEARELLRRAPEASEADARAKVLAEVRILREAKQWSAAQQVLSRANERFSNDIELLYEQSMMAEKLNRLDDMERLLRRVIELKPDHHHAYNALGYALAERNIRLPEAKALIEKALAIAPGEPFITDSLGWVTYRLGDRPQALRLLLRAYASRPDVEIAAHLGEVLWQNGQRDEARRIWREGLSHDAANDVLRETLARLGVTL